MKCHRLSKKYGGKLQLNSYCTVYNVRPPEIANKIICAGDDIHEHCADFDTCKKIQPLTRKFSLKFTKTD